MSSLDSLLVLANQEDHLSRAVQCTLLKPVSNHFAILLDGGGIKMGPILFHFENM